MSMNGSLCHASTERISYGSKRIEGMKLFLVALKVLGSFINDPSHDKSVDLCSSSIFCWRMGSRISDTVSELMGVLG